MTWTTGSLASVRDRSCACVYTQGVGHTDSDIFDWEKLTNPINTQVRSANSLLVYLDGREAPAPQLVAPLEVSHGREVGGQERRGDVGVGRAAGRGAGLEEEAELGQALSHLAHLPLHQLLQNTLLCLFLEGL